MDAFSLGKISVGPPYFNAVFLVPALPLVVLVGVGMHAAWRQARLAARRPALIAVAGAAVLAAFGIAFGAYGSIALPLTLVGFAAALFVMGSALIEPVSSWRRGQRVPPAVLGMALAHFGIGVFVLGVTGVVSYKVEKDVSLAPGESTRLAGYDVRFLSMRDVAGPNYDAREAEIAITEAGRPVADLKTQKRVYRVQRNPMTHAGIAVAWNRDLFVALGDDLGGGRWSMRLQYKPLVRYIWIGALLMACGGLIAMLDRRYRARRTVAAEALAGGAPGKAA
jgi:cytochrome c-type biogenesis protein CcmF